MPASAEPPAAEVTGHGLSRREKAAQALEPIVQAVPEEKRRLTGYILLALLAHVALFWSIRLTYPETTRQPAPRVRAMLALPPQEGTVSDSEVLDREFWNRLHDPSMLILPQDQLDADLAAMRAPRANEAQALEAEAISDLPTLMRPVPLRDGLYGLPTPRRSLEERTGASLTPRPQPFIFPQEEEEALVEKSTLILSGPLASRRWAQAPVLPEPETEVLPARGTTVLRVGADASGNIVHAMVVEGSGNPAIDLAGLQAVQQARFAPQQLNFPAQPARQARQPSDDRPPFPGLNWPGNNRSPRVPKVRLPALSQSGSDDLTWGEAKLFWRLRGPEEAKDSPKAGPRPPGQPTP